MPALRAGRVARLLVGALVMLLGLAQTWATASEAPAPRGKVTIARLKYGGGGDWYANPTSLPRLLDTLRRETPVQVSSEEGVVEPGSPRLFEYPLIYATGHGVIRFSEAERENLRTYLRNGGFFWADDNYGMDESFRIEMQALFPDSPLVELPLDHPIYHAKRRFPEGLPKIHRHKGGPPEGLGIFLEGRLAVFYSYNTDIGDGMEDPSVHGNPLELCKAALDMGMNVVLFALTQQ